MEVPITVPNTDGFGGDQNHPKEKEMEEGKMVVWGGLTTSCEEKQKAREKGKDISKAKQSFREEQGDIEGLLKWINGKK